MKPACLALVFALSLTATVASAQTDTTFTYQGELKENGNPAGGLHNIDFSLWDAVSGGNQIGDSDAHVGVPVVDGKFSVELDFGAEAFDNSDRWLEIKVNGSQLSPRQSITRAPYALQTRGIVVDENENVGIGTNEPTYQLDVIGLVRASQLIFNSGVGSRATTIDRNGDDLETSQYAQGDIKFFLSPTAGDLFERLTLKPDGKVGIGTFSPESLLHVSGSDSIMQTITSSSGGGTWIELENTSTGGERWGVLSTGASNGEGAGKMLLRSISDGRTVMTLQGDGNIGIGTASPVFQLQLTGTAGKPGGGPWDVASDVRLKKNIEPIDDALGTLMRLRGVTFEYIDPDAIHELSGQRIGMIAQEVEKVVPDWVNVRSDGYKTVTPRGFEALTVEALRELRAENDTQIAKRDRRIESQAKRIANIERENAKLRDVNDSLRTRLDSLEQLVEQLALSSKEQPR